MDEENKDLLNENKEEELLPAVQESTQGSEDVTVQPEGDGCDDGDEEDYAPYGVTYTESEQNKPQPKKLSSNAKAALAIAASFLVIALIIGGTLNLPFYKNKKHNPDEITLATEPEPVDYTYVLVHGLGGWGDNSSMSAAGSYWGATSGSLKSYLTKQDYKVVVPTVGPYSSTWDRTCELYAQLTGTVTDYGKAHSEAHNHERYGTQYSKALVPDWSSKEKVNLIGHSFGGATVRMLAYLMANGNEAEKQATGDETSPLFTGGKGNWVFSVTTLASPHNGSQLTEIAGSTLKLLHIDSVAQLMVSVLGETLGTTSNMNLMLDQFGIKPGSDASAAVNTIIKNGTDHAFYDLSPDGAAQLNQNIGLVKGVYYFSYAYSTVTKSELTGNYYIEPDTFSALKITASVLMSFRTTTKGGIVIDKTWFDNDGLVSVVSASYPADESHCSLPENYAEIQKGIWNTAPVQKGDHGTPVGLGTGEAQLHSFYDKLFEMLETISR